VWSASELPPGSDDARIVGTNAWAANGGASLTVGQKLMQLLDANLAYSKNCRARCDGCWRRVDLLRTSS
jgi:hypothetical protein